eukprot:345604_1
MINDSAHEALKATDSSQASMISKITNEIVKLQLKIDSLTVNSEKYITCNNFLNGLKEFLKGLKTLKKSSNDKINRLQNIIDKLKEQELDIVNNIKDIRMNAMNKLQEIRKEYFNVEVTQQIENKSENTYNNESDIETIDFRNNAPLSALELMHKRE